MTIEKNRDKAYTPQYQTFDDLYQASKNAISLIASFHILYWASTEESQALKEFFMQQSKKGE